MNCVYTALNNHLRALGEPEYTAVFAEYNARKQFAHPNIGEYTFAGIVPWLYWYMLYVHNALSRNRIEMKIQRHYVSLLELFDEATDAQKSMMHKTQYWGEYVEEVTFVPAIYCMLNNQHAYYDNMIPNAPGARVIMAIKLMYYGDKNEKKVRRIINN